MTAQQMPNLMKAAVLSGDRAALEIVSLPVPVPSAGEALIRVAACGVCHSDLHVIKGEVSFPRPAVLGHEVSGTIVSFGSGTSEFRGLEVGVSVVGAFIMPCTDCEQCTRGRDDLCSKFFSHNRLEGTLFDGKSRLTMPDGSFLAMYSMGGLAEYSVIPVAALAQLPTSLEIESAAILGCAGLTAFGAVHRAGGVGNGDAVVVVAVGGVGSSIIQLARAAGAHPIIAVDVRDEKLETARALGATDVVNASGVDPVAAVRTLTSGRGVDVAFEALGTPGTFRQAIGMLVDGGRMVAIGIADGGTTAEIEITPLVRRGYTIAGSFGGRTRTDLPEVVRLATEGALDVRSTVTRRYSLDNANTAYQDLARGEILGRAVVVMQSRD